MRTVMSSDFLVQLALEYRSVDASSGPAIVTSLRCSRGRQEARCRRWSPSALSAVANELTQRGRIVHEALLDSRFQAM